MLDDENVTSITNTPADDLPRPPAGRRAARRPAGPPAPVRAAAVQDVAVPAEPPAGEVTPPVGKPVAHDRAVAPESSTLSRSAAAEPAASAAEPPAEPGAASPAGEPEPRGSRRPRKGTAAPQTRRSRKAAAVEDDQAAAAEPPAPVADAPQGGIEPQALEASELAETPARTPRKRATRSRKAAPAEAKVAQGEVPPEGLQLELPQVGQAAAAGLSEDEAEAALADLARALAGDTTAAAVEVAQASNESAEAAQGSDEPVDETLAEGEPGLGTLTVEDGADEAPADEQEAVDTDAPSDDDTVDVAELGTLTVEDGAEDGAEEAGDADEAEEADDEGASGEEGEADDQPRRRRRRRGGRRRRRDRDRDEDDNDEDDPTEPGGDDPTRSDDDADGEDAAEDGGEHDETDEVDASGSRRRRRRRRRRGEGTDGDDDPDTEVVVRVREPRKARSSETNDEVHGIEGSTRLEAKRQRRREGRAAGRRRAPILSEAEFLARRESVERVMVIRQKADYTQIGVLEDGVLAEHYVDRASSTTLIGNIYLGRVQNVLPSMEAAFIDIGRGRNAVLYAGEVDWDSFGTEGQARKMENVFKSGQSVLVQVTKDPVGQKGARLTSHLSLPGRYIVFSPSGELSGISRKLADTERARLKEILGTLISDEASVIVRTAAEGVSQEELVRDVNRLTAQWEAIQKKAKTSSAPALLYSEPDATVRIVRDLFTEDFTRLIVDGNGSSEDAYDTIEAYVTHVAPHLAERLQKWDRASHGDLFAKYRIDEQIAKALERKVFLPSGGSLVIDRTEAMTVIDVNTGKFTGTGGNLEATVTSNNLEAAEEIVRQLRLRDIGGIIVIDFIDMVLPSNRELLLRRLVECLGRDRTRHQVAEVTSLGLVQMTRKKIGTGLAEAFTVECETCKGRGYHRHEDPVDNQAPADGGDRAERRAANRRERTGSGKGRTRRGKSDEGAKADEPALADEGGASEPATPTGGEGE